MNTCLSRLLNLTCLLIYTTHLHSKTERKTEEENLKDDTCIALSHTYLERVSGDTRARAARMGYD